MKTFAMTKNRTGNATTFHENIEDNSNIYFIYKKTIANIVTAYICIYSLKSSDFT